MSVIPYSNACHVFLLKLNVVADIIHEVDNLDDEGSALEARLINAILINAIRSNAGQSKKKWSFNKIQVQRAILLSIIGLISYGIFRGHLKYEQEVAEYMRSLEYRRAKEASQDHSVMKRNHLASINDASKQDKR